MTATRDVTIWCDGESGSDLMSCGEFEIGEDAASVRRVLRRAGWAVGVVTGSRRAADYCPAHRKPPISETGDDRA